MTVLWALATAIFCVAPLGSAIAPPAAEMFAVMWFGLWFYVRLLIVASECQRFVR